MLLLLLFLLLSLKSADGMRKCPTTTTTTALGLRFARRSPSSGLLTARRLFPSSGAYRSQLRPAAVAGWRGMSTTGHGPAAPDTKDEQQPLGATTTPPPAIAPEAEAAPAAVAAAPKWQTLMAKAKELARGIKDGTVELYRNVKHTRRLRAVVRERGIDALTRREIRLMNRTREDLKALVPFLILEIVLPEATPFVVMLFPGILPSPYQRLIPQQKRKERERKRTVEALEQMRSELHALGGQRPINFTDSSLDDLVASLQRDESGLREKLEVASLPDGMVEAMTRYTSVWSRFRTQNGLRSSLQRKLDALRKDDELIAKEGGIDSLSEEEKEEAYYERRIGLAATSPASPAATVEPSSAVGPTDPDRERHLREWLHLSAAIRDCREQHRATVPDTSLLLLALRH